MWFYKKVASVILPAGANAAKDLVGIMKDRLGLGFQSSAGCFVMLLGSDSGL